MKLRALDISEANSYIKRILINDPILSILKLKEKFLILRFIVVGMYIYHLKMKHQS